MITEQDLISIGIIRRTHYRDLPPFVFVLRDGLPVPYRSENISELIGQEGFVLRSDIAEDGEGELTWQDLAGYTVVDESDKGEWTTIGEIEMIDESTINTLATLKDGRMMPLHEDFILEIDTDKRILRVRLPFAL
jgi:ribosomal 30S subunit maturation factor RimM